MLFTNMIPQIPWGLERSKLLCHSYCSHFRIKDTCWAVSTGRKTLALTSYISLPHQVPISSPSVYCLPAIRGRPAGRALVSASSASRPCPLFTSSRQTGWWVRLALEKVKGKCCKNRFLFEGNFRYSRWL